MTRNALRSIGSRMWPVIAISTTALGTAVVLAQTPAPDPHHDAVAEQTRSAAATMMGGPSMMADHKAMMARMAAADQKLDELVARMNAAKGEQKVAAIAAAVTELATQRREMDAHMLRMQSGMMERMMSHMSAMHGSGGMMKKTAEPAVGDTDHSAHHPQK